jgi:hypothetical protein
MLGGLRLSESISGKTAVTKPVLQVSLVAVAFCAPFTISPVSAQGTKAADKALPMASAADAKTIAADAYLQTFPLLQTARELDREMNTADAPDYVGKFNVFRHQDSLPSPKDASIRRKSYDAPTGRGSICVLNPSWLPAMTVASSSSSSTTCGDTTSRTSTQVAGSKPVNILVAGPAERARSRSIVRSDTLLVGVTGRGSGAWRWHKCRRFAKAVSPFAAFQLEIFAEGCTANYLRHV